MTKAIDNIAPELRERLYSAEFRCLSSFLHALTTACGAEGAGVVSVYNQQVVGRRTAGVALATLLESLEAKLLPARRTTAIGQITPTKREPIEYQGITSGEALGDWTDDGKYLLLRRIWPAPSWPQRPGEECWLYIFDPRYVIPPKDCADTQLTDQFGGIVSAFIRWKNEVFARHDEMLSPPLVDPDRVLRELNRLLVRPVLPVHFHQILVRSTPKDRDPIRWAARIEKLLAICKRPEQCRCLNAPVAGCAASFRCPQTDAMDQNLTILAQLEMWRTEFWKNTKHPEVIAAERDRLLKVGLDGLQAATAALHSQPDWLDETKFKPIDFTEGAVGLAGERALLRHFCARGISMALERWRTHWETPGVHSSELEFPAKLASLASTLLGDGKWTSDAIENLLQVVALFGHQVLDIPERVDLVRHLRQTLRGETALHTLKSRYRDHFFHTLEVCFMGFALLKSHPSPGGPTLGRRLIERCREYANPKGATPLPAMSEDEASKKEAELLAQWWTAALIHDTAYGIDIFDGTLKLLEFFSNRREVKEFIGRAHGTVSDMAKPLQELADELKDDGALKKGDHGVIAAASLSDVLNKIGPDTARRFLPAVRAIAFHNTRHPKVNAGRDPVAALLILCDTVQEWGRSSLGFDRSPSVLLSRMMEASLTPPEEQFGPVKRYGLSLTQESPSSPGVYCWSTADQFIIELDYGLEALRECRAKFTWADMTYNLQRVDFRPWAIDLRVHVSVPFPEKSAGHEHSKSQFEHFGDFIEEQEVRFVERWFRIASERNPKKAVSHHLAPESKPTREVIQFNLPELSREFATETPLMGGQVGDFGKALTAWSVYAREQVDAPPTQGPPV